MRALVFIVYVVVIGLFVYAAYHDIQTRTIPNWCNAAIACVGVIAWIVGIEIPLGEGVTLGGRLLGALICGGPFLVANLAGAQIGAGDVKFLAASGLVLGVHKGVLGLMLGAIAAGIWAAYQRFVKKLPGDTTFAFGPYLGAGMTIALLLIQDVPFVTLASLLQSAMLRA